MAPAEHLYALSPLHRKGRLAEPGGGLRARSSRGPTVGRMRSSKADWTASDLRRLYLGFGFETEEGGNHTLYLHPKHPHQRATVPRHSPLPKAYAVHAVKLIDELLDLKQVER